MTTEEEFPVTPYYKGHLLGGETLSKVGGWWSAVLLIRDPRTEKPFIGLYRWQKSNGAWKVRKRFSFKSAKDLQNALGAIGRLSDKLP
jgi:hypothetical protein